MDSYDITGPNRGEEALQQQSAAMKASMDGMAILGMDEKYIFMNEAHAKIYGYESSEQLIGTTWRALYYEEELQRFQNDIMPILYKHGQWRGEAIGKKQDGTVFPQEVSLSIIEGGGLVCVVRDISERKLAEREIWEEKERAQVTLQSIGDAVITTDSDGKVKYFNPVAEKLTGWTVAEALDKPLIEVFRIENEKTGIVAENPIEKCLREGTIVGLANHTVLINKDGHSFAIEDSAAPIRNREGDIIGAVLVFHDVTEKRNIFEQLIYQAYHDSLTDLPNRALFNEHLTLALSNAERYKEMLAVIFLDLDRFKRVNDMLGHAEGDRILKDVANRLKQCLRSSDTIARMGGDEFSVLLPQVKHEQDAAKIAYKILRSFKDPWLIGEHEFLITASLGIAFYPNDGEDAETLMKHADTAMYRAKDQGRNTYQLFTPNMNTIIFERLALESSLRHALERNEFTVFYQPQVNTITGQIVGMEALARWQHSGRGLVLPADFIPLAEDTGLIVPIGEYILRTACVQNKLWQQAGFSPLRLTVNLSACQFQQHNLVEMVAQILQETGFEPQLLELEITETVAMEDVDFTSRILNELMGMGIQIAIDDFGTGYSSLNYLKRFPIHTLKIDRSFVHDIITDSQDAAIVSAIIALAQTLNLKVIAEGVETEDQMEFLKCRQCFEMQGYLFGKPVPAKDFETLLRNNLY
jgi:diguanylate cyclase (GGDEF)-like protein/PAS domain S-box-containing protein